VKFVLSDFTGAPIAVDDLWRELCDTARDYAGHLIGAALLLLVGWFALRLMVGPFRRLLERSRLDPSAASFLANSARTAILVVIVLGVLQQLGVQTASLLTLLGTAGVAIALSLQGSLANFASGLILLSFRMVRVGDLVEVGDVRGRITDMLPFHVVLVTADNQRVTLPNSTLTGGPVRNHSAQPTRRVQWTLPLTERDDLTTIKEALRAKLLANKRILRDEPVTMFLQDWSDDKQTLVVQAWTQTADFQAVQQELLEELGATLAGTRKQVE
jgi:small conductance mechanosensitive channel